MLLLVFILLLCETRSDDLHMDFQECVNSQRIIGGICTAITDRPFQALLFLQNEPKCGASIISIRWILTAAHCVFRVPKEYLFIGVGSSKVNGHTMQYYTVDLIIMHENFFVNESTVQNDIALLRTAVPIKLNVRVQPILLSSVSPAPDTKTIVSGYGVTTADGPVSNLAYLMSVDGKVIEMNLCKFLLEKTEPELSISRGMFCAGNLNGGKDSCQGDSGGPITIGNGLAGIVSWGIKCAEKMMPAFYTDVSYYLDWIMNTARRYSYRDDAYDSRRYLEAECYGQL